MPLTAGSYAFLILYGQMLFVTYGLPFARYVITMHMTRQICTPDAKLPPGITNQVPRRGYALFYARVSSRPDALFAGDGTFSFRQHGHISIYNERLMSDLAFA